MDVQLALRRLLLWVERPGVEVLLLLIWLLTLFLLAVEFFTNSLGSGSAGVLMLEVVIDFLAAADIFRRMRRAGSCSKYMSNIWNWLDLLTIWLVLIHWVLFAVEPWFQMISDVWLGMRYSALVSRFLFWTLKGGQRFHQQYRRVATADLDGEELLPLPEGIRVEGVSDDEGSDEQIDVMDDDDDDEGDMGGQDFNLVAVSEGLRTLDAPPP